MKNKYIEPKIVIQSSSMKVYLQSISNTDEDAVKDNPYKTNNNMSDMGIGIYDEEAKGRFDSDAGPWDSLW